MLTIFYDSHCPLCHAEMMHIKRLDQNNYIELIDLHSELFRTKYPSIHYDKAMKILHGIHDDKLLLGLEVTHKAWTIVGKGFWVAPLNWPVIKQISQWCYLLVARYRKPISAFLHRVFGIGSKTCPIGACSDKNTDNRDRRQ